MPTAISVATPALIHHAEANSRATQTEAHATADNSTLDKIAAALGKIKNNVVQPGLAMLGAGLRKVNEWCRNHPTAALIFGTALAITSIVIMAIGGPAGVLFGGLGLGAGGYLAAKSLPAVLRKIKNGTPAEAAPVAVRTAFTQTPGPLETGAANLANRTSVPAVTRADSSSIGEPSQDVRNDSAASVVGSDTRPRKAKSD